MKTRKQVFWATIAIINALGVVESDEVTWLSAANGVVMAIALVTVGYMSLSPKKARREGHRRG